MYQQVINRLNQLTDPEDVIKNSDCTKLIEIFKSILDVFPHSMTSIAKMYGLNNGNFSRWVHSGRRSPISERTVRNILLSIYTKGKLPDCEITGDIKFKLNTYQRAITIDDAISYIHESSPSCVIIIDRDNMSDFPIIENSLIISVLKKSTAVNISDNSLLIYSQMGLKDSSDITCCVLATKISILFPQIKLIICTHDHFGIDLSRLINCEIYHNCTN